MAKWLMLMIAVVAIAILAYFGAVRYWDAHNTSEAAVATFMDSLADADAPNTYAWLTDAAQQQYTSAGWQAYVRSLDKVAASPVLQTQEAIDDQFNVYPVNSNPQRYTFSMQVQGRQYWVAAVILKQGKFWMVDDFQGGYK